MAKKQQIESLIETKKKYEEQKQFLDKQVQERE